MAAGPRRPAPARAMAPSSPSCCLCAHRTIAESRSHEVMTIMETWCEALPGHPARRPRAGGLGSGSECSRPGGQPPARPESSSPTLSRNLTGVHILVVDDDDATLEFLAAALTH